MSTDISDYDAITQVIGLYVEGARTGKSDAMKPAFHQDAAIYGYAGPDFMAGPIQELYDFNDENGPAPDIQTWITSIDLAETVATVRLEIANWTGDRYTDLFTMLKVDGHWKIMNKVFHLHEPAV
jgi:hypothetical protein